jgi:hypothetical protein
MASATQHALAKRAIRAATLMEFWSNKIQEEMDKQNVKLFAHDANETVTLEAGLLSAMFERMLSLSDEIRGFQRNLERENIRARKHP